MNLHRYGMKPVGEGDFGAQTCVSHSISPWAAFGAADHAYLRLTRNGAGRPKGLAVRVSV